MPIKRTWVSWMSVAAIGVPMSIAASPVPEILATDFGYSLTGPDGLELWWCEGTYKVGRERETPTSTTTHVEIAAARNEYEPFQLVLRPAESMPGIQINISDLKGPGSASIRGESIRIDRAEYVPVTDSTDAFGTAGDWPDPLPPTDGPADLSGGKNNPFWITIHVPADAAAGDYAGTIILQRTGTDDHRVPLRLKVWDFTLPEDTHTRSAYGIWMDDFAYHGLRTGAERAEVHDLYMQNFAEHRVSPVTHGFNLTDLARVKLSPSELVNRRNRESGDLELDLTEFDRLATRYLDELGFNSVCLFWPPNDLFGPPRFSPRRSEGKWREDPAYDRYFELILGPIWKHVQQKGWQDRVYCYLWDEPPESDFPLIVQEGELVRRICPGLKRLVTLGIGHEIDDAVDIWVPLTSHYDESRAQKSRAAGDEIWWYICTGPKHPYANNFIDHPAINQRIHFWMMKKYEVTGTLYWSVNYYKGIGEAVADRAIRNPWETAMAISPGGGHFGNGDGLLLYPPARGVPDEPLIAGPVNSIRWEMIREGLEDKEYFWVLEQALARARAGRSEDPRSAAAIVAGEAALATVHELVRSMTDYDSDARNLYAARAQIAEAIEGLGAIAGR